MTRWIYEWKTGVSLRAVNSAALAPKLMCPVLVAHGTADHVIPLRLGRHLFEKLPSGAVKRWIEIPGADHNNVLITDFPIYAEMAEWMLLAMP